MATRKKSNVTGTKVLAGVTLIGSAALLQYHSIQFWTNEISQQTGFAWSILLELAVLWLWSMRNIGTRVLGFVGSMVLLAGPLYVVGAPLLTTLQDGAQQDVAVTKLMPLVQSDINVLESQLKVYLANSEERSGWLPAIEQTQAQLAVQRTKLQDLVAKPVAVTNVAIGKAASVMIMQMIVLCLMQLTNIMAVCHMVAPVRRKR